MRLCNLNMHGQYLNTYFRNTHRYINDDNSVVRHNIDGVERAVVQLDIDGLWWIVPNLDDLNYKIPAIGPHTTVDDAFVYLRLMAD